MSCLISFVLAQSTREQRVESEKKKYKELNILAHSETRTHNLENRKQTL